MGGSGLPCPGDLTLILGWFFRLPFPVSWPGSPPLWGLFIYNAGFWVPPVCKLCLLAMCRTLLAGETPYPLKTLTHFEDIHTKILQPDGPPDRRPQISPPQSLISHWHIRRDIIPGPNPNPRLHVQALDPRGLTSNSSHEWEEHQTDRKTQSLSQEKTVSLCAVYYFQN